MQGSPLEVLSAFTRLGLTSFGGPIAHIGYFRVEFVDRRGWLSEAAFADLVALCQFLPGPASSKLGFSLGLLRAGYWGGLAAWIGFTLPSALALIAFAFSANAIAGAPWGEGLLHGLKLVAVAIVAQAVWGMARTLCPDRTRATIAVAAAALALLAPTAISQISAIAVGAVAGLMLCRGATRTFEDHLQFRVGRGVGICAFTTFLVLLALSFTPVAEGPPAMFNAYFRSGALVFGGGHVVLPLLSEAVVTPGWVDEETFLSGYGAAQAVPGPLFTFAAFLGASSLAPLGGWAGAALALGAIFLPGILLQLGALPFWGALRQRALVQAALLGVNAAVVGILGAALYDPVFTAAVLSPVDFAIAITGFVLLVAWKAPPLVVVTLTAIAGVAASSLLASPV
ncbi:chromate efflux transporter [Terricaulis sp.]|uniref:chromate efflux transporter n=1 Tax=Terricaulis sp. TaxID=2768686 RepID=UPI00378307EA